MNMTSAVSLNCQLYNMRRKMESRTELIVCCCNEIREKILADTAKSGIILNKNGQTLSYFVLQVVKFGAPSYKAAIACSLRLANSRVENWV